MKLPRVSLRWLLGAVTILASLVFVVSVVSVNRLIRMSYDQRLERGRDLVQRELARWAAEPDPTGGPARFTVLGVRGGGVGAPPSDADRRGVQSGISPEVDRVLATVAAVATEDRAEVVSIGVDSGTVFIGAQRRADGRLLWAAYTVTLSKLLGTWRLIVTVLTSATVLLGVIALCAVLGTTRGARALKRSLVALEDDLASEVARPAL